MKTKITVRSRRFLADLQTPVGIYLKVRDMYPQSALLESSDYHSSENSFSFIGIEPIARFSVRDAQITEQYPDGTIEVTKVNGRSVQQALNDFVASFRVEGDRKASNGLFGYTSYDAVKYFESVEITGHDGELAGIPEMTYIVYRYVVAVNHLRNEMTVTENLTGNCQSGLDELLSVIESRNFPTYGFTPRGETTSPVSDKEYMEMVARGIDHCMRGDVFQIVLSRRFEQQYIGDDFMVYRALRSVNPSPYLFYFDFGSYRIFGSSPETHVKIEGDRATIDPIAGTIIRTGDDEQDRRLAERLMADEKENAEHVMLVDLARNDLSRNAADVKVESYRQIQYYSHVIHMVSRVSGTISPDVNRIGLFADTFPAGTLSGAPKVRAMQLIDGIEAHPRGVYGGCIGHIAFDGNLNQAITIRTFVSRNNTLYFQAGAGVVAKSLPKNELKEVNNKLGALRRAIEMAGQLNAK